MNIMNRFTIKTLKQNKVRTLVTIIGIILSTAMFTGVTSIISSLQNYIVNLEIEMAGKWEGRMNGLSKEQAEMLCQDKRVKESTVVENVGYALLDGSLNEDKPYACIESIQKNFSDMSSIVLEEGRLPKNSSEIVLSQHISENGGMSYKVGDVLTLEVGQRCNGEEFVGGQNIEYLGKEESLTDTEQKQYKVVGICERPYLEPHIAPGYTVFTTEVEDEKNASYDVLIQAKDSSKIDKIMKDFKKKWSKDSETEITSEIHTDLLRFQGKSSEESFVAVLRGMGAILIFIIMLASISLIYNAFSISVGERTKQFGLLKSIGATKKQIRKSVFFEAISLCVIGIPIGIGGGLLGIGITLHYVGGIMNDFMSNQIDFQLGLTVSWVAIVIAVVVAIVTVLISAMIPARRAVKMPAIQALRQSSEIRLRRKTVRSSKLVYKMFGFEGMLANKNLKRNRRKHRMTVFSLAVSVILFLATSSFSNYMVASIDMFEEINGADIAFMATEKELGNNSLEKTKKVVKDRKAVKEVAYSALLSGVIQVDEKQLNKEYLSQLKKYAPSHYDKKNGKAVIDMSITYVEDASYQKYLEEHNLDVSRYMDKDRLHPLIWDTVNARTKEGTLQTMPMLSGDSFEGDLYLFNSKKTEKFAYYGEVVDASDMTLLYQAEKSDKTKKMTSEEALRKFSIAGNQVMEGDLPLGVSDMRWGNVLSLVLPYSASANLPKDVELTDTTAYYILSNNHKASTEDISDFFQNNNSYGSSIVSTIYDYRAVADANNAVVLVVNIFSYGFIILITLIVVANVFNTISTNIQLRRKEFAMLKSVGMTQKGFDRMMNYECLLYGVKGLLFGLPFAFVLCYLMYRSLRAAWNVTFMIPWLSVGIVIVSVFVIVFASMLYSMKKIKRDNPIEALRDDNL